MTTKVEKTITVDVPVSTAYNQWTQFEEFPQFMGGVQKVEQLDDKRLHWVAEIAGVKREWYATIVDQRVDERVAWAATEGATNAGAVSFAAAGAASTLVTLELDYEPEGLIEAVGDKLNIVERQAQSDLEKFKTFIEQRQSETGGWRGEVEGHPATPGVEAAAGSEGDSGKTGVSAKAAVAGVAAAAIGVAAVVASKSGDDSSEGTEVEAAPTQTTTVETTAVDTGPVDRSTGPASDAELSATTNLDADVAGVPDDAYGRTPGSGQELLTDEVELDSTTPGITAENKGNA